jgi:membrane protein
MEGARHGTPPARRRAFAAAGDLRDRVLARAARVPGSTTAWAALDRDHRSGGGLLAGAIAFRLFGALLPLALLVAVALGYAATVERTTPADAGDAVGIAPAVLESVAASSKLSTGTRWAVVCGALVALGWSSASAARAIRAAHSLAWQGGVQRLGRPAHAGGVLVATVVALGCVWALVGAARAHLGLVGVAVSVAAIVPFFAVWLGVSMLLPHGAAPWTALIPGAVLVAVGTQVLHLGTTLFVAGRLERASATYGAFGTAFTILVWLYLLSRILVSSAMLNAALWQPRDEPRS